MGKVKINTYIYPNLRKEIGINGVSLNFIAKHLGISLGTLRNKLSDTTKFNLDEAKLLSALFNKSVEELFVREEI